MKYDMGGGMNKTYQDEHSAHVFVSSGISGGRWWMTVRRKVSPQGGISGTHRVKSPALPLRATKQEAQADLEAYAAKRGWREVPQ